MGSGFLASLDREQRVRYRKWWQKYLLLKRVSWIGAAIFIACWLLTIRPNPLFALVRVARIPLVLALFSLAIWQSVLECPRCGENFRGWFSRGAYFGDECQNCGLSGTQLSSIAQPQD